MDIKKLVSELTLEEKASLVSGGDFWNSQAIERLGIPAVMLTDGPCGLRKQGGNTDHLGLNESIKAISYPTGACVGSSFDRNLLREMGETLGDEAQAENIGVLLGPAMNIKRSPLCGRNFEYFSEDPYLTGEMAIPYIDGLQSKNVGSSPKHFAVNSQEHRRMTSDSILDERTYREIYLSGFENMVKKSKPWTIMCSYNRINGTYASDNKELLTDILRDEWGFDGYVVSDWGATNDRIESLKAGMDLQMPGDSPMNTKIIIDAVNEGRLDISVLDTNVERILDITYRYLENRNESIEFDYEAHHQKAREIAVESMVLLKNDGTLPLSKDKKVAFIGEYAEKPRFQGGGSSHVNSYKVTSAIEAAEGLNITYAKGFETGNDDINESLVTEAINAAADAEAAVIFVGLPDRLESEGYDRANMNIPGNQVELINQIAKVQRNVVVVVHCGGAIEMPWECDVSAILYAYLGGEAVGAAVLDLLYGDKNPSGKLAETFPIKLEDNPSYLYYVGEGDKVEYREGVFVGYRYYDKKDMEVAYPFGYGLSYTTFKYSDLKLDKTSMKDNETLSVSFKVKNTGNTSGKEVVQLYVGANSNEFIIRPVKELRGFDKIFLAPGEEKTVEFTLDKRAFAYYNMDIKDWYVPTDVYQILVGSSSRDILLMADINVESTTIIKKVFDINSTIGDIMKTPLGAQMIQQMTQSQMASVADANADALGEGGGALIMKMLEYMPLRGAAMFGMADMTQLEQFLVALNNQ